MALLARLPDASVDLVVTDPPYAIAKDGYMYAPDAPGLGIEWDRRFFRTNGLTFG